MTTIAFAPSVLNTAVDAILEDPEISDSDLGRLVLSDSSLPESLGSALRDALESSFR